MSIQFSYKSSSGGCGPATCLSKNGCPPDVCPDFVIRRHDTKPPLKIFVEDCDGPMDLQGLVVEVNMWALAKLKTNIDESAEYFRLANDIGFEQVMVGDIIVMDRVRSPERMLVVAFDETNKLIKVQRAYHGTTASSWKKGSQMRIFRVLNGIAESEMVFDDQTEVDGTVTKNIVTESYLVYEWQPEDTCLPGCYWLEFKLLKMIDAVYYLPGGNWTGKKHQHTDGLFYTGTAHTSSSVKISYDQIQDLYLLPESIWEGDVVQHSEINFTGSVFNDGSVVLSLTAASSVEDTEVSALSITPSFTDESLTPLDFGCILGEGVEWVRRFPISSEGFLIRVENSPTMEI